jgi:hypothetical protein
LISTFIDRKIANRGQKAVERLASFQLQRKGFDLIKTIKNDVYIKAKKTKGGRKVNF